MGEANQHHNHQPQDKVRPVVQESSEQLGHGGLVVNLLAPGDEEGDGERDGDEGAEHEDGAGHQPELEAGHLDQALIAALEIGQDHEHRQACSREIRNIIYRAEDLPGNQRRKRSRIPKRTWFSLNR